MAGIQAIASKIKKLSEFAETVQKGKMISVVYMDANRNIEWPENPAPGVLVVPKSLSAEKWMEKYCNEK